MILMLKEIIEIIIYTFIPTLELRFSIPWGILKLGLPAWQVFIIAVLANISLGIVFYSVIDIFMKIVSKIKILDRLYKYYIGKTQKKIKKYVDKYGEIGVALFVGIPLPMSGVYSGAIGAYIIGLPFRKFVVASIIGVLIAAVVVTAVVVTGSSLFNVFLKV